MALPPTQIYRYVTTPDDTVRRLAVAGLLRRDVDREELVGRLDAAARSHRLPEGMVGPNVQDVMAGVVRGSLNRSGAFLADTPLHTPSMGVRIRVFWTRLAARLLP